MEASGRFTPAGALLFPFEIRKQRKKREREGSSRSLVFLSTPRSAMVLELRRFGRVLVGSLLFFFFCFHEAMSASFDARRLNPSN